MARSMTVAAAQTGSVEDGDLRTITESAHAMLDEAARLGVRLLTFSELFLTPFFANRLEENFDRWFLHDEHEVLQGLREKARRHGIALVLPFAERAADGYFNSAVFVLACNRVGIEGPRNHLGRSMVVDPRGMIVAEAGSERTQLLTQEIDLDAVTSARKKFPWWRDRRPDLYGPLVSAA